MLYNPNVQYNRSLYMTFSTNGYRQDLHFSSKIQANNRAQLYDIVLITCEMVLVKFHLCISIFQFDTHEQIKDYTGIDGLTTQVVRRHWVILKRIL